MEIKQQIKLIPPLEIGDGKEKKAFEFNWKFKNLKDWFLGFTIRWR